MSVNTHSQSEESLFPIYLFNITDKVSIASNRESLAPALRVGNFKMGRGHSVISTLYSSFDFSYIWQLLSTNGIFPPEISTKIL